MISQKDLRAIEEQLRLGSNIGQGNVRSLSPDQLVYGIKCALLYASILNSDQQVNAFNLLDELARRVPK